MKKTIRTRINNRAARPRRRTSPMLVLVVTIGLVSGLMVADMAIIGIKPVTAHGLRVNGCTAVPDSGPGFDFHRSCDAHDRCYRLQPWGSGNYGRLRCDLAFRHAMQRDCAARAITGWRRRSCDAVAVTYYLGVRVLGGPFWNRQMSTPIA